MQKGSVRLPHFVLNSAFSILHFSDMAQNSEQIESKLCAYIEGELDDRGRAEIERHFRDYLGVQKVIWLRNGITGDDTHGHVDDLARFVSSDTVVLASESDRSDPNYEPLRENAAILRAAGLRVVKLPMPRPLVFAGQRLPASYANFYIANGVVIVPEP